MLNLPKPPGLMARFEVRLLRLKLLADLRLRRRPEVPEPDKDLHMPDELPRGIRNNNPGNIDRDGTPWEGLSPQQTDPRFCVFSSAEYGIRALAVVLKTYEDAHGLTTLQEWIDRWAPPTENNSSAYLADVCTRSGVDATATISIHDLPLAAKVIEAIIAHENGDYIYAPAILNSGISLADLGTPSLT